MEKHGTPMNFSRAVAEEPRAVPPTAAHHMDGVLLNNPSLISSPFHYPRMPPPVIPAVAANTSSVTGGDEAYTKKKLKFLVSFGGKILPRPSDGMLRYVGGQTRIICVKRNVLFRELVQKLADIYGQNPVIRYQLPDEDLDALVSVSCPDDLENMIDECEKLLEKSSDGSDKLRLFLFSRSELNPSGMLQFGDAQDNGQRYVDAVNGAMDGNGSVGRIVRKESIASAASTQNSELSGNEAMENLVPGQIGFTQSRNTSSPQGNGVCADMGKLNLRAHDQLGGSPDKSCNQSSLLQPEFEVDGRLNENQQVQGLDLSQYGTEVASSTSYFPSYVDHMHSPFQTEFTSAQFPASAGSVLMQQNPYNIPPGAVPLNIFSSANVRMACPPGMVQLHSTSFDPFFQPPRAPLIFRHDEFTAGSNIMQVHGQQTPSAYHLQMPGMLGPGYILQQVPFQGHAVLSDEVVPQPQDIPQEDNHRFADCLMCQKALPHAHSDTVVQEQRNCSNVPNSSLVSPFPHTIDATRSLPVGGTTIDGTLTDTTSGQQGSEGLVRTLAMNSEHLAGLSVHGTGELHENDSALNKMNYHEHPVVLETVGPPTEIGAPRSNVSQFTQEGASLVQTLPGHCPSKQEFFVTESANTGAYSITTADTSSQTKHAGLEYLKGFPGKFHPSPEFENTNFRISNEVQQPTVSYIAGLPVRPPDISGFTERRKFPTDILAREENLEPKVAQAARGDLLLGECFVDPISGNMLSRPFMEGTSSSDLRPMEVHEVGRSIVPEKAGVMTFNSEWENNMLFRHNTTISNIENAPTGSTMPSISQFINIIDEHDSRTLFSGIQDPFNLNNDPRNLPPQPSKIPHRKEMFDPFGENRFANGDMILPDTMAAANVRRGSDLENAGPAASGSAEDLVKHELQAVAESVAISVLQPSSPSHSQFPMNELDEPIYEVKTGPVLQDTNLGVQLRSNVEGNQGNKVRPPEKVHIAFPVNDNHLQIIKNSDLEELRELGSGTFGTVYYGKWRGTDVAIKRINDRCFAGKPSEQDRMRSDFWNEAVKLAELHHPNVVAFYGLVLDGPGDSVATVTEFMANGSLRNVLQKSNKGLDKRKRLLIAMDVAFGMEYLHGKNIIHFDLKSDNLLVNLRDPHRPICKVGDLGLSKVKCQTLISGGVRGTLPWIAPELLNGSSSLVSEKVDVYSFGIVMWELLTGEEPYADLYYGAIIGGIVNNTLRPPVPEDCHPEWQSLMEWCWSSEPSNRPTFTDVSNQLRYMAAKVTPKPQPHPVK